MLTSDTVRKEAFRMVVEMSPWEIDKDDAEEMKRVLFYTCGIVDMADRVCDMLEEKGGD